MDGQIPFINQDVEKGNLWHALQKLTSASVNKLKGASHSATTNLMVLWMNGLHLKNARASIGHRVSKSDTKKSGRGSSGEAIQVYGSFADHSKYGKPVGCGSGGGKG